MVEILLRGAGGGGARQHGNAREAQWPPSSIMLDTHQVFVKLGLKKAGLASRLHQGALGGKGPRGAEGTDMDKVMEELPAQEESASLRPGTYSRGTETVDAILKAALAVLIEEGAAAFTIRRIAAACGMKVGNVSYHFPRKELLVQVLLDELLVSYGTLLDERVRQPGLSAEERLRLVILICLEDIAGKRTTRLFTELWALANHNDFIAERVQTFYQSVHDVIGLYVAELNPALSDDEVHTVALYISACMEGSTPFLGFEKPWGDKMPAFIAIATTQLVALAKTITSREIAGLNR